MSRFWMLFLCLALGGCDVYTSATKTTFDANAAYARHIADAAAAGVNPDGSTYTREEAAYHLECFARTFQNLSDAGHWRPPTYAKAPATRPTTLPWNNRE